MASYSLTGNLIDSEGNKVVVSEYTANAERNDYNINYYKNNGFKGVMMLTVEHDDGDVMSQSITCK